MTIVCRSPADLLAHRAQWDDLARHAAEPNPFYESWFALPALDLVPLGSSMRFVFLVADDGTTLGFVPLVAQRRLIGTLTSWTHPYIFLTTPLLRAGREAEALDQLLAWLRRDRSSMPLLHLETLGGDGPVAWALTDALTRHGRPSFLVASSGRALLQRRTDGSATEYLENAMNGRRRKELRRKERLLENQGRLERRSLARGVDPTMWIGAFLAVEASGWKGREGTAFASDPAHARFFRTMAEAAHAAGRLEMLGLFLNDRPIAVKCNLLAGAGAFAFKIGYDEMHASASPGMLLEAVNIERIHQQETVQWMDSCAEPGVDLFARMWTEQRRVQTLWIATGRPPGDLAVSLMPLARWLKRRLRRS